MRKTSCCLLLVALAVTLLSRPAFSQPAALAAAASSHRGDLDENGKVDIFDLLGLLKALSGQDQTDRQKKIADIDSNGKVDIFDLLGVLKVLAGNQEPGVIYWTAIIGFN